MAEKYGYARVSTKDQNEDRQLVALREAGIKDENIFIEKTSGKDFDRPKYRQVMKSLKSGDLLVVKSLDRLGRDYKQMQEEWRLITHEKGANIVVLDMPILDTRERQDLTSVLISDLFLQIVSYVSQTEREYIRQRQAEGIAAARARGVYIGGKKLKMPPEFDKLRKQWEGGEISIRKAAKKLGISHMTFKRHCLAAKKDEEKE